MKGQCEEGWLEEEWCKLIYIFKNYSDCCVDKSRTRETSWDMIAVMCTIKIVAWTRVTAVELWKLSGFLIYSEGRARWWWITGGRRVWLLTEQLGRWWCHLKESERPREKHIGEVNGSGNKEFMVQFEMFIREEMWSNLLRYQENMSGDVYTSGSLVRSLELQKEIGTNGLYLEVFRI